MDPKVLNQIWYLVDWSSKVKKDKSSWKIQHIILFTNSNKIQELSYPLLKNIWPWY